MGVHPPLSDCRRRSTGRVFGDSARSIDVLVLGDSAFASLGATHENAIDLFASSAAYATAMRLHNAAVVGTTAADALIHLRELSRRQHFDAVIVSVGHCDACALGPRKPYRSFWLGGVGIRGHSCGARCVLAADHTRFLTAIFRRALAQSMAVFCVVPASKRDFPPAIHAPHSLLYKLAGFGDTADLEECNGALSESVRRALVLHNTGSWVAARRAWTCIESANPGNWLGNAAANNLAVIDIIEDQLADAERRLERLSRASEPAGSIAAFNLGVLHTLAGRSHAATHAFSAARECDTATHRVTDAHREAALAALAGFPSIRTIDAAKLLGPDDILDYCHPTPAGHRQLHAALRSELESVFHLRHGDCQPEVRVLPVNPDRYLGERRSFFLHFGVVPPDHRRAAAARAFSDAVLLEAERSKYSAVLARWALETDRVERQRLRILRHPLFGHPSALRIAPPLHATDRGRLSEIYFFRNLQPLLSAVPYRPDVQNELAGLEPVLPTSAGIARFLRSIWEDVPALGVESSMRTSAALVLSNAEAAEVAARCASLLDSVLEAGPVSHARLRTIGRWFLREALVFGTSSHLSQLYDRASLWDVATSCVWGLLRVSPLDAAFKRLTGLLRELISVHERHLGAVAAKPYLLNQRALERYAHELTAIRAKVHGWRALEV